MAMPIAPQSTNRDQTFDLMRLAALVIIVVLHHMPVYYFNFYDLRRFGLQANLSCLGHLMRYFGLGSFVFMSGYLLSVKAHAFSNFTGVLAFLKKRLLRIFPLYWLALTVFLGMFYLYPGKEVSIQNVVLHVFGLQLFYGEPIPTVWFVGLIAVYYVLLAVVGYFGHKWDITATLCLMAWFLLISIKIIFSTVDNRLVLYWPVFHLWCLVLPSPPQD